MRTIENGMLKVRPDGATADDVQREYPGETVVFDDGGGRTRKAKPGEHLKDGAKVYTIPKIVKGVSGRVQEEVDILAGVAGGRNGIVIGEKVFGTTVYTGILLKRVALSSHKFRATCTDMLFLLPPQYPALPPVGVYLNYKWPSADHHFTLQTHYGGPDLRTAGWFWYCVALGGGFNGRHWRPGTQASNGHNLCTLFVAARYAINTSEAE